MLYYEAENKYLNYTLNYISQIYPIVFFWKLKVTVNNHDIKTIHPTYCGRNVNVSWATT